MYIIVHIIVTDTLLSHYDLTNLDNEEEEGEGDGVDGPGMSRHADFPLGLPTVSLLFIFCFNHNL